MNECESCIPGVLRSLLYFDHLICVCLLLSCITRLKSSVLFQPARDATHKMSFYWSEHCAPVSSCRRRQPMIGFKSFVCRCVFCLNKPVSSAQDLLDSSGVYKLAPVFGSVIQLHFHFKWMLDPLCTFFFLWTTFTQWVISVIHKILDP